MHFFWTPVKQLLQLPAITKQQWIELVELARQGKQVHDFARYAAKQWFVQAYLVLR